MGTEQSSFSLGTTILASGVGFCFGVLGIIISQWCQRKFERATLCDVLLTEILDILKHLEEYESRLREIKPCEDFPKFDITKDDMTVFTSNTSKISLLGGRGAPNWIITFYSKVRRLIANHPSQNAPHTDANLLQTTRGQVESTILTGHWALNASFDKLPKYSSLSSDIREFWKRREADIPNRVTNRLEAAKNDDKTE